ncbi:MAG TPA: tripartite tricarboxylate transporter substrate binding protein [Burkholderiales bacterium]|nr:tripartite tricarboxylate transporter substrate binding protein [Burkholderiales bacterium]
MRIVLFLVAAALTVPLSALGQEAWPAKPVRVVIGYSAGGGNDIVMRLMQPELLKGLGQPVVVENRPGAQSIIAAELVAKSPPDGYTLFMGPSGPMTINPATYAKLPYDPIRDFAPVSLICEFPLIVTVNAKLPIRSVQELVGYARANPGAANYASSAGVFQLTTELFKQKTGTAFTMIPYKGSGESVQAVASGLVMMTIVDPPPAAAALKSGSIRALAVTSPRRHPSWPDVPTMAEAGVPDMEVPVWMALFAPAKTPPAIVARLQAEVARAVRTPQLRQHFDAMGIVPVGSSSQELAAVVARDLAKYKAVARAANIHND